MAANNPPGPPLDVPWRPNDNAGQHMLRYKHKLSRRLWLRTISGHGHVRDNLRINSTDGADGGSCACDLDFAQVDRPSLVIVGVFEFCSTRTVTQPSLLRS